MTELEQLKIEYREIPVPADGPKQMLRVIAGAKRKRSRARLNAMVKYATVAAAVLVVVVLLPGIFLFSGGFGGASEEMALDAECVTENMTAGSAEGFFAGSNKDTAMAPATNSAPAPESPEYGLGDNSATDMDMTTEAMLETQMKQADNGVFPADREAISKEILRQMEERMLTQGELYYIKSEEYPEGFDVISEAQEYYINDEGQIVIVFEAGTVAPEEQGIVEFVIPARVVSP